MTIAMMLDFKMGDIPGFDPSKAFPYHDVTYYREIAIVARFLLNHCIDIGQMGWFAVGMQTLSQWQA